MVRMSFLRNVKDNKLKEVQVFLRYVMLKMVTFEMEMEQS